MCYNTTKKGMSMIKLFNSDNRKVLKLLHDVFDVAYCDMIYQDLDLGWIDLVIPLLEENGIIMVQTDYHSVAQVKLYLDERMKFVNWIVTHDNWGGRSKRCFGRKHDDILIYAKSDNYKFYPERVLIPKVTAGTAFDKGGTGMQIPTDNWYDLGGFSTVAKERVKLGDKNIQWQKPLKLMNRLMLPFTDEGDNILDPFMGSGSLGEWCFLNSRNYLGIEIDEEIFGIASQRLTNSGKVV
jgi:site-specific DNA-methyltransferase (adenine-specific)